MAIHHGGIRSYKYAIGYGMECLRLELFGYLKCPSTAVVYIETINAMYVDIHMILTTV